MGDIFHFEGFRLRWPGDGLFRRDEQGVFVPILIGSRALDVLGVLVRQPGCLIPRREIFDAVWPSTVVENSNLNMQIAALRRLLDDRRAEGSCIQTIPGRGYRFVVPVTRFESSALPVSNSTSGDRSSEVEAETRTSVVALAPLPDVPSIAVLPFANLSDDPAQDYFADGIVEEVTTALSKVRSFFVTARTSSFTYKGRAVDVKQVGRELGVRYMLEGSVRKAGDRIRISAQLINTETGAHVWAERYDRVLADLFAVQDEISERVVAAIEPQLYTAEQFRSQRKPPESLDAWECVVRALSSVGRPTRAGLDAADALCRRAIAITPGYGQAHSLLAWILVVRASRSGGDVKAILPEAMAEARTALDLDAHDPWAHMTYGVVSWRMRRHDEAVRAVRRALELNPNFAIAHAFLGLPLAITGAHDEATERAEHALRLSPRDVLVGAYASVAMAFARFAAGRYADAVAWARKTIEISSEYLPAYFVLVAATAIQGDLAAASEALAILLRLQPRFSLAWMSENMAYSGESGERLLAGLRKAGVPE